MSLGPDDYPKSARRSLRHCAKGKTFGCNRVLWDTDARQFPRLQEAMARWVRDQYTDEEYAMDDMRSHPYFFDDKFIIKEFAASCVWEDERGPAACQDIQQLYMKNEWIEESEAFLSEKCTTIKPAECWFLFNWLVDKGEQERANALLESEEMVGSCLHGEQTEECKIVFWHHFGTKSRVALRILDHFCNVDLDDSQCVAMDKMDRQGAPHRRWRLEDRDRILYTRQQQRDQAQADAQAQRLEDQAQAQRDAQERAYEREQERQEQAEQARQREENADKILDAVESIPGSIKDGMDRNQRELDEQIRRQNEIFKQ